MYDPSSFQKISISLNPKSQFWSYKTFDQYSVVLGANYFSQESQLLSSGDVIFAKTLEGQFMINVLTVNDGNVIVEEYTPGIPSVSYNKQYVFSGGSVAVIPLIGAQPGDIVFASKFNDSSTAAIANVTSGTNSVTVEFTENTADQTTINILLVRFLI